MLTLIVVKCTSTYIFSLFYIQRVCCNKCNAITADNVLRFTLSHSLSLWLCSLFIKQTFFTYTRHLYVCCFFKIKSLQSGFVFQLLFIYLLAQINVPLLFFSCLSSFCSSLGYTIFCYLLLAFLLICIFKDL